MIVAWRGLSHTSSMAPGMAYDNQSTTLVKQLLEGFPWYDCVLTFVVPKGWTLMAMTGGPLTPLEPRKVIGGFDEVSQQVMDRSLWHLVKTVTLPRDKNNDFINKALIKSSSYWSNALIYDKISINKNKRTHDIHIRIGFTLGLVLISIH